VSKNGTERPDAIIFENKSWKMPAKGVKTNHRLKTNVKKQNQICVAFGYGAASKPLISKPSQNQAATRRGLACFWEGRLAVPDAGCVKSAPF
jgi:hypothetical protein